MGEMNVFINRAKTPSVCHSVAVRLGRKRFGFALIMTNGNNLVELLISNVTILNQLKAIAQASHIGALSN